MLSTRRGWLWLIAVVLLGAFVWGLEQVAVAPLQTGEVYPPYSSLRSDPVGAKALYESLAELPGLTVEHLYKPRATVHDAGATILVLGVDPVSWSTLKDKTLEEYERLVSGGGRLVIGFVPVRVPFFIDEKRPVEARWNIRISFRKPNAPDDRSTAIPRHSALHIVADASWRRLSDQAVERTFGAGSIVLVADTYALSNEGLREARDAELVAQLVGPSRRVLFDENHFGVAETGSVTKLMRKYRLEGAVGILALVAGLFLWRSASSFLPPREARVSGAVTGRDSLDGLAALLHRGVPEKELIDVCLAEWSKSGRPAPSYAGQKDDPVTAYRDLCRILSERK